MDAARRKRASKAMSWALRHAPDQLGLELDAQGWVAVDALLRALPGAGVTLTRDELDEVVVTNDKRRFALSPDGLRIRASQGHSVEIELGYAPEAPPALLFHGTALHFVESIRAQGLLRGRRRHVHLSAARDTALAVGRRHGTPVVLEVESGAMHASGHAFFLSDNGVWLVEAVPPEYIRR